MSASDLRPIFVFGSNLAGIHGAGAALYARQHYGAVLGVGVGPTGHAYAIPTKDQRLRTLSLGAIAPHVSDFIAHAVARPRMLFQVTAIGCGLAGYKVPDIAPLFARAPENCLLAPDFAIWLHDQGLRSIKRQARP